MAEPNHPVSLLVSLGYSEVDSVPAGLVDSLAQRITA
jgi:hypothetical protein